MHVIDISPDQRLLDLQRAAYAVEAALIGDDRIPPLHEPLSDLLAAPLTWVGAFDGDALLGAIAWEADATTLDINRLVVSPSAFRRGIGRLLVATALDRAAGRTVLVSTGRDNIPARSLYEGYGFAWLNDIEVIPGLWITNYHLTP
ncbi:GNAT family N-acetyltransferase [Nonomuraea sp. NPDC049637]|uniref:GNAT family N-acetyltransferase n=1 Tax=Nonomuraea sp. NPDC049637 TaxID=3154356 RepID=UPI0034401ABB